eukprot:g35730.t1
MLHQQQDQDSAAIASGGGKAKGRSVKGSFGPVLLAAGTRAALVHSWRRKTANTLRTAGLPCVLNRVSRFNKSAGISKPDHTSATTSFSRSQLRTCPNHGHCAWFSCPFFHPGELPSQSAASLPPASDGADDSRTSAASVQRRWALLQLLEQLQYAHAVQGPIRTGPTPRQEEGPTTRSRRHPPQPVDAVAVSAVDSPVTFQWTVLVEDKAAADSEPMAEERLFKAARALLRDLRARICQSLLLASRVHVVYGDLVKCRVDAVVNPTNSSLLGSGSPVAQAIHAAAGPELLQALRALPVVWRGGLPGGECRTTEGFKLPAKYIVHTSGEFRWVDGRVSGLGRSYEKAMDEAARHNWKSIAFPIIGAGTRGFSCSTAGDVAVTVVADYLLKRWPQWASSQAQLHEWERNEEKEWGGLWGGVSRHLTLQLEQMLGTRREERSDEESDDHADDSEEENGPCTTVASDNRTTSTSFNTFSPLLSSASSSSVWSGNQGTVEPFSSIQHAKPSLDALVPPHVFLVCYRNHWFPDPYTGVLDALARLLLRPMHVTQEVNEVPERKANRKGKRGRAA